MHDLPSTIGVSDEEWTGYADDVCVWASGNNLRDLREQLNRKAENLTRYATANCLALNPAKTQLLLAGRMAATSRATFAIDVGGITVLPANTLDLLGVTFDSRLSTSPHTSTIAKTAKAKAALIHRLTAYLPPGQYLRQLACGLMWGKVGYAASVVRAPRLQLDDPISQASRQTQVAINNVARSICGWRLQDGHSVADTLSAANISSLNQVTTVAVALEAWKALHSESGPGRIRNPLGRLLNGDVPVVIGSNGDDGDDSDFCGVRSRRALSGCIPPPLPVSADTFVYAAYKLWNRFPSLRAAKTLTAARRAVEDIRLTVPL